MSFFSWRVVLPVAALLFGIVLVLVGDEGGSGRAERGFAEGSQGMPEPPASAGLPDAPPVAGPAAGEGLGTRPYDLRASHLQAFGPLHAPEYGARLERGREQVTIPVLDARGHPVARFGQSRPITGAWALHGDYGQPVPVRYASGTLEVGDDRRGLDPGPHEVRLSLGGYGNGSKRFAVGPGTAPPTPLRLPGWRRVVTLVFQDREGRPLPWISAPPRFLPASSRSVGHVPAAGELLRDPPGGPRPLSVGFGGGSGSYRSRVFRGHRYVTDAGRYHLPVVAGVKGEIRLRLESELFGTAWHVLEGDFVGSEWEAYPVVLDVNRAAYAARDTRLRNADDPGRRSLLRPHLPSPSGASSSPSAAAQEDPFDLSSLRRDQVRYVVRRTLPTGVTLWALDDRYAARPFDAHLGGLFTADLRRRFREVAALADGYLLRGPRHELSGQELPDRLQEIRCDEGLVPVQLVVRVPPSLAARTRAARFQLLQEDPENAEEGKAHRWPLKGAERDGQDFVVESWLTEEQVAALDDPGRPAILVCSLDAERVGVVSAPTRSEAGDPSCAWKLTRTERRALAHGFLEIDFAASEARAARDLFVCRAVGRRGEGLPFAEVSIVPVGKAECARALRAEELALAEHGHRPSLADLSREPRAPETTSSEARGSSELVGESGEEVESELLVESKGEEASDRSELPPREALVHLLGSEAVEGLSAESLARLWRLGAWYDTRRKARSDEDGFIVSRAMDLEAGRLYVAWFWSRSRNDLEPDRRVLFEAAAGVTDLGVIELPSHPDPGR